MAQQKLFKAKVFEGSPLTLMARVVGAAGTNITQASLSEIKYIVDQYNSESEAEKDTNPTVVQTEVDAGAVSSLVYDTLQTDNDWEADTTGYNFKLTIAASKFPVGDKWNGVEVWFNPTSGDDFCLRWIVEVVSTGRD